MRLELELTKLFDSKVCSQKIDKNSFLNHGSFPERHQDTSTVVKAYSRSIIDLTCDLNAYKELYSKDLPALIEPEHKH